MSAPMWMVFAATCAIGAGTSYDTLKGQARDLPNLGRFLQTFLGDCESSDPEFDRPGCEAKVDAFRLEHRGKRYTLEVDDIAENVHFAGWDKRRRAYRMHLTPFFEGRDLALTVGKPHARKKDGLPAVANIPIWVKLPNGETEFVFRRRLERGMVRLELLVEPATTWAIKRRRAGGHYRGLSVKLRGLRLIGARSGRVLAEQTY